MITDMDRPRRKKDTPIKSNKRKVRYPPIKLPALPEQEERIRMIKKKRTIPSMKIHLTKTQRKNVSYPATMNRIKSGRFGVAPKK